VVIGTVAAALLVVAILTAALPALRGRRVNPVEALGYEKGSTAINSVRSQRRHRIHPRRAPRRQEAGQRRDGEGHGSHDQQHDRIVR